MTTKKQTPKQTKRDPDSPEGITYVFTSDPLSPKERDLSPEEQEECRRIAHLRLKMLLAEPESNTSLQPVRTKMTRREREKREREETIRINAIRQTQKIINEETARETASETQRLKNVRDLIDKELAAETPLAARETTTEKTKELTITKKSNIPARITFAGPQAFFDGKDLGLPTGAEVNPVEILKKLVESFGKVVRYKDLDENSDNTASDFLRGKIRTIRLALQKHKVPCEINSKKWAGYVLNTSQAQS